VTTKKLNPLGSLYFFLETDNLRGIDTKEYIKVANDEILVIVQVEHKTAVESLDKLLAVDGIDLAMVGPMDLSGSMGLLGDPAHPEVVTAIDEVAEAGKRHQVPLGILSLTPEDYKRRIAQGFKFFLIGSDIGIVMQGGNQLHDRFRLKAE
jgi:2-keto-3-deoxy-L-rhamnonate aldolase RhmA